VEVASWRVLNYFHNHYTFSIYSLICPFCGLHRAFCEDPFTYSEPRPYNFEMAAVLFTEGMPDEVSEEKSCEIVCNGRVHPRILYTGKQFSGCYVLLLGDLSPLSIPSNTPLEFKA